MPIEFPVIINKKGTELPKDGTYFVVGGNGVFCRQSTKWFDRMVRVEQIGFLNPVDTSVNSRLPIVPPLIIGRALLFFRRVFQKIHSESVVVIFINEKTGEFDIECPEQTVSYQGIHYDVKTVHAATQRPGWFRIGSIHSHCDFNAFHSSTDRGDEAYMFPGIHITLGHVNTDNFSCEASFAFVKDRFPTEPLEVIAGLVGVGQKGHYNLQLNDDEVGVLLNEHIDVIEEEWLSKVTHADSVGRPNFKPRDTYTGWFRWWPDRLTSLARRFLPLGCLAEAPTTLTVEEEGESNGREKPQD